MDFVANFELENNNVDAEFELNEPAQFDAIFEINPIGATWGSIQGHIENQTDLYNILNAKVDVSALDADVEIINQTINENYNTLDGKIDSINGALSDSITAIDSTIGGYGDIVTYNASDFATVGQGALADTAIQPNDNISVLNNDANYVNTTDLATKVSKSGDTMTGDLEINKSIYLTSVAATTANPASKLYFGPKSSPYNYMAANTSGVFGIYNNSGKGIGCYPTQNLFPTNNIDLGRSNNKWKDIYASGKLYGASTNISITNLISGANKGATAIQPNDNISTLTNDAGYITSASLPTVNDATITIQKNGTDVNSFTLNQASDDTINITVPTTAADVGALPNTTTINDLTTAEQQAALNSGATTTNIGQIATNTGDISTINGKIPAQASSSNQLADKNFVNSSVQTATANFRGNWNDWAAVPSVASDYPEDYAGSKTPTVNDYLVVQDASDYTQDTLEGTWRFKYTGDWSTDGKSGWIPEYQVNETPLTAAQLAALNSGITANDVTLIGTALQPNDNISELTNNTGYITGITSSDVTTALGYTPLQSSDISNMVTTNTTQDITEPKTFIGQKRIAFKQASSSDKLGFTLYNNGGTEKGYLEFNPSNLVDSVPLMTLGNYASAAAGITHVGFRKYSSVSGASGAYNLLAPLISDARTPFNLTTTYTNFYLPLGVTNGTLTVTTPKTGLLDISTLLPDVSNFVTSSDLSTTLSNYVLSSSLATVATTGSYDDLSDKPTIPTVPTNISAFTNDSGYITNSALSGYATENYVDTGLSAKQDTLVSGTNIKTVNNTSLLDSGNIDTSEIFIAEYGTTTFTEVLDAYNTGKIIFCYDDNDNIYAPITNYTVTDFYFSTGLINNISASYTLDNNDSWDGGTTTLATVATSGSYNDLSNKPTIPAAQVQANWNETDTNSMAYIQNKPNIPSGVVVDQTYDGTSANAQSGVAMAGELANYTKTANLPLTPYFATSTTAADTATKVVSIPAITTLNVGQIICVKPTITSTVATSKIKLNDFTAYNMRYNGANITTSTDSVVWNENWVSWFVFDGTYWQFAGHGYDNNTNTTYSAMSVSEGTTGTATNSRTVRADYLKQIIQGTKLTGLSTADNSAVVATDNILTGIGKLQAEAENAYNKAESKADWFEIESPLTSTYDNSGIVLGTDCYITSDGVLTGGTAWNDGIMDTVTSVNLINDYWEWNGYFKFTSITEEEELIAVDGVNDNGFLFHIKPNGDVINPDDSNKLLANVGANDWVEFNVVHQAGDTDITVTLDTTNGKVTTTTALATTTAQALHNTCWHCNNSYGIEFLVRNDESWWRTSAGGTFYPFVTRYIGADLSSKQDALVSGTNIKTINNTSVLGNGNIDTSEIFFAVYGTTTTNQITQALASGKTIICVKSTPSIDNIYYYSDTATLDGISAYTFSRVYQNTSEVVYVSSITNQWNTITKTLANDDLSNVSSIDSSSAVATALNDKVNKSGDTMTGELSLSFGNPIITLRNEDITKGTNPSTDKYTTLEFCDGTGSSWQDRRLGYIQHILMTDGTSKLSVGATKNEASSTSNSNIVLQVTSAGAATCSFPNTTCVDGQWVSSYQEAIGSTAQTINSGATKNIPFSNLPAKNCEVMFTISQSTNYDLAISSSVMGGTVNRALKQGSICMIMPVSSDKTIKVGNLGSGTASINFVRMCGYRVLGTNTNT